MSCSVVGQTLGQLVKPKKSATGAPSRLALLQVSPLCVVNANLRPSKGFSCAFFSSTLLHSVMHAVHASAHSRHEAWWSACLRHSASHSSFTVTQSWARFA